jgi:hypothetical protein
MPSNIVGYEWTLAGTAHVAYQTGDRHIHEMTVGENGMWHDADITAQAGGPRLESAILTGYAWPDGQTRQIAYVSPMDSNGHIHELVQREGNAWSYADITLATDAPPTDGRVLAGLAWKAGRSKHVIYMGRDGHIHELAVGVVSKWHHTDVTEQTGAPNAESPHLAGFAWEGRGTQHIVYMSGDGHIHELMREVGKAWRHADITALTNAPIADGRALVACAWEKGKTRQIIYTNNRGNLFELVAGHDDQWRYADVLRLCSAPLADGSALATYAWETDSTRQIVYVGSDRHVHEITIELDQTCNHVDLTRIKNACDASNEVIVGYEWSAQFAKHVIFLDTRENPAIHAFTRKHGELWLHLDLTKLTGGQVIV